MTTATKPKKLLETGSIPKHQFIPKKDWDQGKLPVEYKTVVPCIEFKEMNKNGKFHHNTQYKFVVDAKGKIRMFDYNKWRIRYKTQNLKEPGHSSLFSKNEYDNMIKNKYGIIWAGDFNTDGDGKIKDWDNASGHFLPNEKEMPTVAYYLGLSKDKFVSFEERMKHVQLEHANSNKAVRGSVSSREELSSVDSQTQNAMALFGDAYPLDGIYIFIYLYLFYLFCILLMVDWLCIYIYTDVHGYGYGIDHNHKFNRYLDDDSYSYNNDVMIYAVGIISGIIIMIAICCLFSIISIGFSIAINAFSKYMNKSALRQKIIWKKRDLYKQQQNLSESVVDQV